MHHVSGAQWVDWHLHQRHELQYYPPNLRISSGLHQSHSLHFPGPGSTAAQTVASDHQHRQQQLGFAERESLEPRSLSLSERALHGRQTQGSLLA